jgi:hypothetical protein
LQSGLSYFWGEYVQAGEIKPLKIWVNPQPPAPAPASPVSLAGATAATLKIQHPVSSTTISAVASANSSDPNPMNHFVSYTTQITDFPVGGQYILQLIVTFSDGTVLKSAESAFQVGGSL